MVVGQEQGLVSLKGWIDLIVARFREFSEVFWNLPFSFWDIDLLSQQQSTTLSVGLMLLAPPILMARKVFSGIAGQQNRDFKEPRGTKKNASPWGTAPARNSNSPWGNSDSNREEELLRASARTGQFWLSSISLFLFGSVVVTGTIIVFLVIGYALYFLVFWGLIGTMQLKEARNYAANLFGGFFIIIVLAFAGFIELAGG